MVRLMKEKRFPAAFKCYYNFHKINSISSDNLHYKMVIHVHSDSTFRRYQKEMRFNPDLWPLYRRFLLKLICSRQVKRNPQRFPKIPPTLEKITKMAMKTNILSQKNKNK